MAAVYGPRLRPGLPVSFPVGWDDLDDIVPGDFTLHNAVELTSGRDPWADAMPAAQSLSDELIEGGRTIPIARVQAMHEGKRRARRSARAESRTDRAPRPSRSGRAEQADVAAPGPGPDSDRAARSGPG